MFVQDDIFNFNLNKFFSQQDAKQKFIKYYCFCLLRFCHVALSRNHLNAASDTVTYNKIGMNTIIYIYIYMKLGLKTNPGSFSGTILISNRKDIG